MLGFSSAPAPEVAKLNKDWLVPDSPQVTLASYAAIPDANAFPPPDSWIRNWTVNVEFVFALIEVTGVPAVVVQK